MIEATVKLVDGVGPERIAHLGTIECDTYGALANGAMVGDVGEFADGLDSAPAGGVERLRYEPVSHGRRLGTNASEAGV